jgi:hypothetical protein
MQTNPWAVAAIGVVVSFFLGALISPFGAPLMNTTILCGDGGDAGVRPSDEESMDAFKRFHNRFTEINAPGMHPPGACKDSDLMRTKMFKGLH